MTDRTAIAWTRHSGSEGLAVAADKPDFSRFERCR